MTIKFSNTGFSTLLAGIDDTDQTLLLQDSAGVLFPEITAPDYFVVTLSDTAGHVEICKVNARVGDELSVDRGWEDTSPRAWTSNTPVEMRITAGVLEAMLQQGSTLIGRFPASSAEFVGPRITDPILTAVNQEAEFIGPPGGAIPNGIQFEGGQPPKIDGEPILTPSNTASFGAPPIGGIIMFYGDLGDVPSGWALCDGTGGTPDLREQFVIGAAPPGLPIGTQGGSTTASTSSAGTHNHAGVTGNTALTADQIPPHRHNVRLRDYSESSSPGPLVQGQETLDGDSVSLTKTIFSEDNTTANNTHNHTVGNDGAHAHTVASIVPPFYALAFIMRTA